MITLGIETSCDETALALLETKEVNGVFEYRVISSLIHSQADLHNNFGGVYPTLAKREHSKNLLPLLRRLLDQAKDDIYDSDSKIIDNDEFNKKIDQIRNENLDKNSDLIFTFTGIDFLKTVPKIDRIAVTEGPGLEPTLWVGICFGQILSSIWSIDDLVSVNHMEGHILGSLLNNEVMDKKWAKLKEVFLPAVALLISGGHTELVKIEALKKDKPFLFKYSIIGQTKDDAVGEAFDKVARLLSLPYPGGPHISKLAKEALEQGISSKIKLPRPMMNSHELDFSFSGLKTAVLYAIKKEEENGPLSEDFKKGLAREFEDSVNETLGVKLRKSIEYIGAKTIIIGGGVIANSKLRQSFRMIAEEYGLEIYLPSEHVSGDNALMIALAGAIAIDRPRQKLKADGTKRLN